MTVTETEMAIRIVFAFLLGGVIGLEREMCRHEAGLRTHILVCVGAALIMLTSIRLFDIYKSQSAMDPARLASNVIAGIGFLGAGAIIRSRVGVRGLTTASSLWVVAALGLSIGCGLLKISVFVTLLTLAVLVFLRKFENALLKKGGDGECPER